MKNRNKTRQSYLTAISLEICMKFMGSVYAKKKNFL